MYPRSRLHCIVVFGPYALNLDLKNILCLDQMFRGILFLSFLSICSQEQFYMKVFINIFSAPEPKVRRR